MKTFFHAQKSLLFDINKQTWMKKGGGLFDVKMGTVPKFANLLNCSYLTTKTSDYTVTTVSLLSKIRADPRWKELKRNCKQ